MQGENKKEYTTIICPECGKETQVETLRLVYSIPFTCKECNCVLKSK